MQTAKARTIPEQASSPSYTVAYGGFTKKASSDGWVGIPKAVRRGRRWEGGEERWVSFLHATRKVCT